MQHFCVPFLILVTFVFHSLPTDDRKQRWVDAISPHADAPYTGMICSEHFYDVDFIKNTKTNRMRKQAVPQIFDETKEMHKGDESVYIDAIEVTERFAETAEIVELGETDEPNHINVIEVNEQFAETAETVELDKKAEKNEWYHHYLNEKAKRNVEIQKLRQRIKTLADTVEVKRKCIASLEQKLKRENARTEALQNLVAELNAEKLLDPKNLETLKASISLLGTIRQ